jgi:hypothetical protein
MKGSGVLVLYVEGQLFAPGYTSSHTVFEV